MKKLALIIATAVLSACGTMKTVDAQRSRITINSSGAKSYCQSIPRVYSGVSHNWCTFYGEANYNIPVAKSAVMIPLMFIDTAASAVADTVVLPYTIYLQAEKGSIKVQ